MQQKGKSFSVQRPLLLSVPSCDLITLSATNGDASHMCTHTYTPRKVLFLFVSASGKLSTDISTLKDQYEAFTHSGMKNKHVHLNVK